MFSVYGCHNGWHHTVNWNGNNSGIEQGIFDIPAAINVFSMAPSQQT